MESSYSPSPNAPIHQLEVKTKFDSLNQNEKLYAHHFARAAWYGSRIIMRQVSMESIGIFEFVMSMYKACSGDWEVFLEEQYVLEEDLKAFLEYAGMFLCNLGNYYGEGDQKFVPGLTKESLTSMAGISEATKARLMGIIEPMFAVPPYSLGYSSKKAQSSYYPSMDPITQDEIAWVTEAMHQVHIEPENTRIRRTTQAGRSALQLLQASVEKSPAFGDDGELAADLFLVRGDHSDELAKVCEALEIASQYAQNETQRRFLQKYIESFRTGSLAAYQEAQKLWVTDRSARVEHFIGFVEPYRDPAGIRAEWVGAVGIADVDEVQTLQAFVEASSTFIRRLPWADKSINDGKGLFEKDLFEAPDFTSIHTLAVASSVVWEASNLPNYNYIRETCGFKNIVFKDRMSVNNNPNVPCFWIDDSDLEFYRRTAHIVRYLQTVIHELLGHGTGKLLCETSTGQFNFDIQNPPTNPLSGCPVNSYYLPGETWYSKFGKLSGTVEECRAILMSMYFMDDKDLLKTFGYTDHSDITAEELLYASYLTIGIHGLQALEHYNVQDQAWGQVHFQVNQAYFTILKYMLQEGDGVMSIAHDADQRTLKIHVGRSKLLDRGKPALGQYLSKIHLWRCTADVSSCREMYDALSAVNGEYEEWRKVVISKPQIRWKFVQPNTFVKGNDVEMKLYPTTNEGIVQSWFERDI